MHDRPYITSEIDVVNQVTLFLMRRGYRTRCEIPNMGQVLDIAATKGRWLTAIEAKVRDWRRAILQCTAHESVADFVCIAVATKTVSPFLLETAADRGYGIIHCDPSTADCKWALTPKRNKRVWPPQRHFFSRSLRRIDRADGH